MVPLAKAPGAQFEASIDGTPRTYRDRKELAIEAAEHLKRKHPHSAIVVRDLQSGEATAVEYKPDFGAALKFTRVSRKTSMTQNPEPRPPKPPAPPPPEPLPPAA